MGRLRAGRLASLDPAAAIAAGPAVGSLAPIVTHRVLPEPAIDAAAPIVVPAAVPLSAVGAGSRVIRGHGTGNVTVGARSRCSVTPFGSRCSLVYLCPPQNPSPQTLRSWSV